VRAPTELDAADLARRLRWAQRALPRGASVGEKPIDGGRHWRFRVGQMGAAVGPELFARVAAMGARLQLELDPATRQYVHVLMLPKGIKRARWSWVDRGLVGLMLGAVAVWCALQLRETRY
jgi:hypothetical protein